MITNITSLFKDHFPIINQIGLDFFDIIASKDFVFISKRNDEVSINSVIKSSYIKPLFNLLDVKVPDLLLEIISKVEYVVLDLNTILTGQLRFYFYDIDFRSQEDRIAFTNLYPASKDIDETSLTKFGLGFKLDGEEIVYYKHYYVSNITILNYKFDKNNNSLGCYEERLVTTSSLSSYLDGVDTSNLRINYSYREQDNQEYLLIKNIVTVAQKL